MLTAMDRDEPGQSTSWALLICATAVMLVPAALLSARAIGPATAYGVLPRWDLAGHLMDGWTAYHHLIKGELHLLLWHLWTQGYWPPGQSVFQVPFFLTLGGAMTAGLYSSVAALVMTGVVAAAFLSRVTGGSAWVSTAITIGLMATSPYFLAYGTVAMSEMLGALAQVGVLLAYARFEQQPSTTAARWFAMSLSALFFTKYNYFVLLAIPLAGHMFLVATTGSSLRGRWSLIRGVARGVLTTPAGLAIAAYTLVVWIIVTSGGLSFSLAGLPVSIRSIGYFAHPVLYGGLFVAWRRYRRGALTWSSLTQHDPSVGPLLIWFVMPITLWLASPYPNHVKDITNLLVNVPVGTVGGQIGMAGYLAAVRDDYFAHPVVAAVAFVAFAAAAVRYQRQPPLVRLLLLTTALQFLMVTTHQTRDARFMMLSMPLFWMASAHEIAHWVSRAHRWAPPVVTALVTATALAASFAVTESPTFKRTAFENYVISPALADAFRSIRAVAGPEATIAVIGKRDDVSPGLIRWHLGPPMGAAKFPLDVAGVSELGLVDLAHLVVLIEPSQTPTERAMAVVREQVATGALLEQASHVIPTLGVSVHVFRRRSEAS